MVKIKAWTRIEKLGVFDIAKWHSNVQSDGMFKREVRILTPKRYWVNKGYNYVLEISKDCSYKIKFFKKKEEAMKFAIAYMRSHPRG